MGKKRLSIDIGRKKTKVIESQSSKNGVKILKKIVIDTPEGAYSDGELTNLIAIAHRIEGTLKKYKIRSKNVHMNINSTNIITREIQIPITKEENIRGIVNREIEGYIPVDFDSYSVEYKVIWASKTHCKVIIVVFQKSIIQNYYELCRTIGLKGVNLDINANIMSCILSNCKSINGEKIGVEGSIVIELGEESITFSGFEKNDFVFTRNIEGGFNSIFKLFQGEEVSRENIEEKILKQDFSHSTSDTYSLEREIHSNVVGWCSEIERLQSYYINTLKKEVKKVYIYGGRSKLNGIRRLLQNTIGVPVEIIREVQVGREIIRVSEEDILNNIGMCLKESVDLKGINFFREIHERNRRARKIERIISVVLGITLATGVGIVGYWKLEIESQIGKISHYEKILESKITKIKEDKINKLEKEHAGVESLLKEMKLIEAYSNKRSLNYSSGINDILNALPQGVKVSMLSYKEGEFSIRCYGKKVEQVYEAVENLKRMGSYGVSFSDIVLSKEKDSYRITFELSGVLIKEESLIDQ